MTETSGSRKISGWLWIWSNDVRRYVKAWFVLSDDILTHYEGQEETTCNGVIHLAGATIDFDETCKFVIFHDEAHHLKADDQEEKRRWERALLAARGVDLQRFATTGSRHDLCWKQDQLTNVSQNFRMTHSMAQGIHQVDTPSEQGGSAYTGERDRSRLSVDTIAGNAYLNQIEQYRSVEAPAAGSAYNKRHKNESQNHCQELQQLSRLLEKMKHVMENIRNREDLINQSYLELQGSIANKEMDLQGNSVFKHVLEKVAEYQASAYKMTGASSRYMNIAEAYFRKCFSLHHQSDCDQIKLEKIVKSLTEAQPERSDTTLDLDDEHIQYFDCNEPANGSERSYDLALQVYQAVAGASESRSRRTRVPNRPNVSDSLWSVLKNCVGNDLSKMPLPVSFAEPLSLLQRLTEDFEYAHVLDKGSECADVATQLAYVAAFIASSYSTTIGRSGKPFNPLLGETYECDRSSDLGWRSIAEQVSHHPPVAAIHGEGKNWTFWMDQSIKTKFKGTTVTVVPTGECHLSFKNGSRYSWQKPNTSIHNVIVGKLWVEQEGDVDIICATSPETCKLTFIGSGWTGDTFCVKGVIKDGSGNAVYDIAGKYSTQIEYRPTGSKNPGTVVWKRTEPPKDHVKFYSFTLLACQLNEMEDGVAPTDSRNRPDQRLMEEGNFDAANLMKKKLEDFQRANKKDTWTPSWFKRQADPDTKTELWTYGGEYWPCKAKKDWSRCPNYIYSPP